MTSSPQQAPPVVCTLGPTELAERGLEWADLTALALTSEPIDGGIASTYPLELAAAINDLVARESGCCGSWLTTSVAISDTSVRLELTTTNPEGLAVITRMSGRPDVED